ncbi:predicted membrane transporter [Candida orthopsilosis Co 90-125]|uniref:Predicted membrane transporter n=1 Tax=Candida orthopsilosis (strain 90-125) TaxID=1136231 RepID=H8WVU1_CANO9|nr:predicted membrane transporter [Candida orthopsilosis Co 90-125]CCG20565.1 predicted membrane transporter [Candida orthopsilosis Co 90-125]
MVKGIAIGMSHAVIPIFQYEIIPSGRRGRILSFYILATSLGNLLMYSLPMMTMQILNEDQYIKLHWLIDLIPISFASVSIMLFPESPKWLASNNEWEIAAEVLESIETANSEKSVRNKYKRERKRLGDKHYVVKKYSTAVNVRSCSMNALFGRKYIREVSTGILLQLTIDLIGVIRLLDSMRSICIACQVQTLNEMRIVSEFDLVMRYIFILAPMGVIDLLRRKDVLMFGMTVNTTLVGAYSIMFLGFSRENETSQFNLDIEWGLKVEFGKECASIVLALTVLMDMVFHSLILPVCWLYILESFSSSTRSKGWIVITSLHWLFECSLSLIFPFLFSTLNGWLILILFLISLSGTLIMSQLKETKENSSVGSVFLSSKHSNND